MRFDDIMRHAPVNEDWENRSGEDRRAVEKGTMTMQLTRDSKRDLLRIQKAVDKFNALRAEAVSVTGDENGVFYDNSSTFDAGPCYISELEGPQVVDDYSGKGPAVVVRCRVGDGRGKVVDNDSYEFLRPDEDGLWFNSDEMLSDIRYYTKCVNRAIWYFRQYNPSDEDEEGNNRKWERFEAARDVEERFTMKKNNRRIVNEEFDGEFDGPRIDLVKRMKRTVLAQAIQYYGRVSRSSLEYSLRKNYPEATDEEIEMAINGDVDIYGESVDADRAFNASTFSRMKWLGESSETLEYSTPYVDGETAPENTVDDEDAIRSLIGAWNRIADRFAERMRQHGYSPQVADAIVTAAAGRFCKSIESGI